MVRAAAESNDKQNDDFVTRVLKQNPSQVEPKFLIGDKLYTLKEKEGLVSNSDDGLFGFLSKRKREEEKVSSRNESGDVFLKDLLREYRGKLYVPEQVFGQNVSQEEEFKRNLDVLPRITFEDFLKAMRSDQVKVLSFVEDNGASWFRDFVVELKEIPGDKNLQRTKW